MSNAEDSSMYTNHASNPRHEIGRFLSTLFQLRSSAPLSAARQNLSNSLPPFRVVIVDSTVQPSSVVLPLVPYKDATGSKRVTSRQVSKPQKKIGPGITAATPWPLKLGTIERAFEKAKARPDAVLTTTAYTATRVETPAVESRALSKHDNSTICIPHSSKLGGIEQASQKVRSRADNIMMSDVSLSAQIEALAIQSQQSISHKYMMTRTESVVEGSAFHRLSGVGPALQVDVSSSSHYREDRCDGIVGPAKRKRGDDPTATHLGGDRKRRKSAKIINSGPKKRKFVDDSSASDLDEFKPTKASRTSVEDGIFPHKLNQRPVKSAARTSNMEGKTLRAYEDVIKWAGGKAEYNEVMTSLKKDGLWSGGFDTRTNLRLVRYFFQFRRTKANNKIIGTNLYIRFSIQNFIWWIREGPSLGKAVDWNKSTLGPNERAGLVKEQLEHFIDCVVEDRYDADSISDYERNATALGMAPWSGKLVLSIVGRAWSLQSASLPLRSKLCNQELEPRFVRQARLEIFFHMGNGSKQG